METANHIIFILINGAFVISIKERVAIVPIVKTLSTVVNNHELVRRIIFDASYPAYDLLIYPFYHGHIKFIHCYRLDLHYSIW